MKNKYFSTVTFSIILSSLLLRCLFRLSNHKSYIFSSYNDVIFSKKLISNQAFIFLDSPVIKINQYRQRLISQEIIIHGIDNNVLKEKLLHLLNINEYPLRVISTKELSLLISKLKISGFVTNVTLSSSMTQNHQVIEINLSVNPVLKQISIIGYPDKIIPYSYLLFIFRNQVGYPISFNRIDESLNLITKWYHNRGYKWAAVTITKDQFLHQHVIINIQEGIISRIEFVSYNQNTIGFKDSNNIPVVLFLGIMQMYPLQVLNLNHLEQGIIRLKKQKLILHCYYEVSWITKVPGNLSLLLKLDVLDSRSTYLFNNNINISKPLMEVIELLLKYSLDNIFENRNTDPLFINKGNFLPVQAQNSLTHKNNILYTNLGQEDRCYRYFKSHRLLNKYQYFYEWHGSKLLFIVADHLGFRHYIQNLAFRNSYCYFDGSFPGAHTHPYFRVQYELPLISANTLNTQHIIVQIFKRFFDSGKHSKLFPLEQLGNSYFCYQESLGQQMGINLELINNNDIFSCYRKIIYTHIASKYLHTHNYVGWNQLYATTQDLLAYQRFSYFRPVWTHTLEETNLLHMHLAYRDQHDKTKDSGIYFKSIHLIPQGKSQIFYGNHNGLNYSNKTSFGIDKICRRKNHKIRYAGEFAYLFGNRDYLPPSQEVIEIKEDIVRGYSKEAFPFPLKFGKINLEYHIPLTERNTIFFFIDYSRYILNCDMSWQHNLCLSQFRFHGDATNYNRLSCGLGLHVSIPIRQIPPLRLEYSYNLKNTPCLHLRVYK